MRGAGIKLRMKKESQLTTTQATWYGKLFTKLSDLYLKTTGPGKSYHLDRAIQVFIILLCAGCVPTKATKTLKYEPGKAVQVVLDKPVVVSTSQVNEKRWGYHQFVSISPYPGDKILLRFHVGADAVKAYGTASPAFISADKGKSWQPCTDESLPSSGMTYPLLNGHFICLGMAKPLNVKEAHLTLPPPAGKCFSYAWYLFYHLKECPPQVQRFFENMAAARWTPDSKQWQNDTLHYDSRKALIWTLAEGESSNLVPRTAFERPPLAFDKELLYADYRTNYLDADDSVPPHLCVTCMVSQDNGRNWQRRSLIALDRKGKDALTEPMLAQNVNGELVCVIRRTDQEQKSMLITFSKDKGETWETPRPLDQLGAFGVMPCLVSLESGIMALSYGRPGIWLSFSLSGTGREWTDPICLLEDDAKQPQSKTDGYTTLLAIGPNQLLLAYTDFNHKDAQGNQRKAVLVRKLTITGIKKIISH